MRDLYDGTGAFFPKRPRDPFAQRGEEVCAGGKAHTGEFVIIRDAQDTALP